jgi:ATP synthase protein I
MLSRQDRREIRCILISQVLAALVVVLALAFKGTLYARSGLYGALVSIIPTRVFAVTLFRYQGARQAKRIVHSLYVGEGLKLLLTAALFAGIIIYLHPIWWALWIGFVAVHFTLCMAPLLCTQKY